MCDLVAQKGKKIVKLLNKVFLTDAQNFWLTHFFQTLHCFFLAATFLSVWQKVQIFFVDFLFSLSILSQRRQNIPRIFLSNRQTVQNFFVDFIFFCHFDKKIGVSEGVRQKVQGSVVKKTLPPFGNLMKIFSSEQKMIRGTLGKWKTKWQWIIFENPGPYWHRTISQRKFFLSIL